MSVMESDPMPIAADGRPKAPKGTRKGVRVRGSFVPYVLIAPAVVVLLTVLAYPLVDLFVLAFQNVNDYLHLSAPDLVKFIGFDGFTKVLGSGDFWQSTQRTVLFTLEVVAASILIALLVGLLLERVSKWAKITVVTALMFVWAVPQIVVGTLFKWLFANTGGVVDYFFYLLTGNPGWRTHDWFADPDQGLYVVVAVAVVWGALPFLVIGINAALTQVPKELVEASKLDGANGWQSFRHVVLPVIKPFLVLCTALSFIWDFQVFGQIWALRDNAPEPGYRTLGVYLYQQGLGSSHYSTSAVVSILMILLMLAVLVFYIRQVIKIGEQD
jgi:N,N'-diacetylchitobiose transport system permease protein